MRREPGRRMIVRMLPILLLAATGTLLPGAAITALDRRSRRRR
jgi:hypothetical protein